MVRQHILPLSVSTTRFHPHRVPLAIKKDLPSSTSERVYFPCHSSLTLPFPSLPNKRKQSLYDMEPINTTFAAQNQPHDIPTDLYQPLYQVARLGHDPNNVKDWYSAVLQQLKRIGQCSTDALCQDLTPSSDRSSSFSSGYQTPIFNSPASSHHGQLASSNRSPKLGSIPETSMWSNNNESTDSIHAKMYSQSPQQAPTQARPVQSLYRAHSNTNLSRHSRQPTPSEQPSPQRPQPVQALQSMDMAATQQGYNQPTSVPSSADYSVMDSWNNSTSTSGRNELALATASSMAVLTASSPWSAPEPFHLHETHPALSMLPTPPSASSPGNIFFPNTAAAPILLPYELSQGYGPDYTTSITSTGLTSTVPSIHHPTTEPVRSFLPVFGFSISKSRNKTLRSGVRKGTKSVQGGSVSRRGSQ